MKLIHYGVEDKRLKNIFTLLCGAGRRGKFLWTTKPYNVTCKKCFRELNTVAQQTSAKEE